MRILADENNPVVQELVRPDMNLASGCGDEAFFAREPGLHALQESNAEHCRPFFPLEHLKQLYWEELAF